MWLISACFGMYLTDTIAWKTSTSMERVQKYTLCLGEWQCKPLLIESSNCLSELCSFTQTLILISTMYYQNFVTMSKCSGSKTQLVSWECLPSLILVLVLGLLCNYTAFSNHSHFSNFKCTAVFQTLGHQIFDFITHFYDILTFYLFYNFVM